MDEIYVLLQCMSGCCLTLTQQFFISWREQVNFQWDWWGDPLLPRPTQLDWFFFLIMLAHWNNSLRIDMPPHSDTLSWFRVNHQCLLFLLNVACLAEKQQIPISESLVWPDRDSNLWPTVFEVSMRTITPPMRFYCNGDDSAVYSLEEYGCKYVGVFYSRTNHQWSII